MYAGHKVRRSNNVFGYWVSVNIDSCSSLAWHTAGVPRSRECAILLDVFWRCVGGSSVHHLERLQFHYHSKDDRLHRCNNQFRSSLMFAPNIVGNLGGGVTQLFIVWCLVKPFKAMGVRINTARRVVMLVPAAMSASQLLSS